MLTQTILIPPRPRLAGICLAAALALVLGACGGDGATASQADQSPSSNTAASETAASETTAVQNGSTASSDSPASTAGGGTDTTVGSGFVVGANADPQAFDPGAFSWPLSGINQWLPLTPGYQSVREGTLNRGGRQLTHRRVYTVTDVTKEIAGVRAILVLDQDFDAGEVAEQAIDYFAQDRDGNVWYVGSYTEGYQGGQFVNARDAWLAGVDGAQAGVIMMSDPTVDTGSYRQATVPGEGEAFAQISEVGTSACVPFQCFDDVLAVLEDGTEFKYFARGVGGILTEPNYSGGEQETEKLVSITELTPEGLAELSNEALRMDQNAQTTAPRVFGGSAAAQRIQ